MIPFAILLLLLFLTGYLSHPLLALLLAPFSPASPLPVNFTLTSSGHLQAHLSLDLLRYILPTVVQLLSLLALLALSLYLFNELLNSRVASGRWITRGWFNTARMSRADWQRQVVLITGGAGGLGGELARLALARGACVVTLDVKDLPKEVLQGSRRFHYRCDVSKIQEVQDAARQMRLNLDLRKRAAGQTGAAWPTLPTILINNAGVHSLDLSSSHILTLPPEQISRVLQVNLLSHFHVLQTFLPSILRRATGGHVVSVASSMGHVGCASMADYVSSKFGVIGLHEVLYRELRAWRNGRCDQAMTAVVDQAHGDVQGETEQTEEDKAERIFGGLGPSSAARSRVQTTLVIPSHIATAMFPHWHYPWPFDHLTPTLTPTCVAERILEEIDHRRSAWVYLPRMTWPTGYMGVLSDWCRECMLWLSGTDAAVSRMRVLSRGELGKGEQGAGTPLPATTSTSVVQTRAQKASAVAAVEGREGGGASG